jgi:hypothetical protein
MATDRVKGMPHGWKRFRYEIDEAITEFGATVREKLSDKNAEPEEQLRTPLENLLRRASKVLGLKIVVHGETRLPELGARPDFAVDVAGARVGYIELKRPSKGVPLTPTWKPSARDAIQWEKLRSLPNLIYGDGINWARYVDGVLAENAAGFGLNGRRARREGRADEDSFARMLYEFLVWNPVPPPTLDQFISVVASLCKILNDEVKEILRIERRGNTDVKLFTSLAEDWRRLLYPYMSDDLFANAYAQTITFALLLARVDGISFDDRTTADIAKLLRKRHPLMGRALEVLTDHTAERGGIVETLTRIISVINWEDYAREVDDPYALLYERFLEIYDPDLRKQTGTYYTPREVVRFMVRFVDEIVRTRLNFPLGLADDDVIVIDPAMGTGTYVSETVSLVASTITALEGPGAVPARIRQLCNRLIGFEVQAGPFAVSELRIYSEIKRRGGEPPDHMKLCITDTLDSPYQEEELGLGSFYYEISQSQTDARYVKARVPVLVAMGNPPFGAKARKKGKWILERGGATKRALIDDFVVPGSNQPGCLYDMYVFFWRWALWKVFEAHPDRPEGVVAFISPSAFTKGPGFAQMREFIRRIADEGWILDLSPEGHQSDARFRIFPDNQNSICISIFVRRGEPHLDSPAVVHHLEIDSVPGAEKIRRLNDLHPDSDDLHPDRGSWQICSSSWKDPFRPAPPAEWRMHPPLARMQYWDKPGVMAGRTWVFAPRRELLEERLEYFGSAAEDTQPKLFGQRPKSVSPDAYHSRVMAVAASVAADPKPPMIKRVVYRSFDRQYFIADERFVDRLRPELWAIEGQHQVYTTELHRVAVREGPGLLFSSLIPDRNHFMGQNSGRVFPLYLDSSGSRPNFPRRLLDYIGESLSLAVNERDLLAYIACIVANRAYVRRFADDLRRWHGVRIPLTREPDLWTRSVQIGSHIIWVQTFGECYADFGQGRPRGVPRLPEGERPYVGEPAIPWSEDEMPDRIEPIEDRSMIRVGKGIIERVPAGVWDYRVGGVGVIDRWFRRRKKNPSGRRSELEMLVRDTSWRPETTTDLLDLLNVLGLLVRLEPQQAELLGCVCEGRCLDLAELDRSGALMSEEDTKRRPLGGIRIEQSLFDT